MNLKSYGIVSFSLEGGARPDDTPLLKAERDAAIRDLIEFGDVQLVTFPTEFYHVTLSFYDARIILRFETAHKEELQTIAVSPSPYRKLIQDYFLMVESYETIRKDGNLQKLETVDMARRSIHNEGAELLQKRLRDKISMDFESARRLFTLICVLQA